MYESVTAVINNPSSVPAAGQALWASDNHHCYWLTDQWKVFRLDTNSNQPLWQVVHQTTDQEEAYRLKKIYDERLPDELYEEIKEQGIQGFSLLSKKEYDTVNLTAGSTSLLDTANHSGLIGKNIPVKTHGSSLLAFADKTITICRLDAGTLVPIATTKTKGKVPLQVCLHPTENLLVYGTNHGEIYAQAFTDEQFDKPWKIDDSGNTCYQIEFSNDGHSLIVAGLGYLKTYQADGLKYKNASNIQTSIRSFVLTPQGFLIANKGMNGLEWYKHDNGVLQKAGSLEPPFPIDRMLYLPTHRELLITSNPEGKLAILKITD